MRSRCVVPTLAVDGRVTSDAHNIVLHADDFFPPSKTVPRLYPDDETRHKVKEQFDAACLIFIEALTYGEVPGGPKLPWMLRGMMKSNHGRKRKALLAKLRQHENDPFLRACYEGKLNILSRQIEVLEDEANLIEIVQATKQAIGRLNDQLTTGPVAWSEKHASHNWLCGKQYTIADMQWALTLVRLHFRGYGDMLWRKDYPAVEAYRLRLMTRPAVQRAVVAYHNQPGSIGRLVLSRKLAKNRTAVVSVVLLSAAVGVALVWTKKV